MQTDIRRYFGGAEFQSAIIQPRLVDDNSKSSEGGGDSSEQSRVEEIIERMDQVSEDLESQFQKMGNIFRQKSGGQS